MSSVEDEMLPPAAVLRRSITSDDAMLRPPADEAHLIPTAVKGQPLRSPRGSLSASSPFSGSENFNMLSPTAQVDAERAWESQSVIQLINTVLGAGVVGYPFCYRSCGLGLATVLVLLTLLAAEYSMQLLLVAGHIASKRSYEDLARHSFGGAGQSAVDACVVVMNVGSLVAYLNLLADVFSLVAGTVVPPGAEPSRNAMLVAITLCAALPVALFVRSPPLLSAVSQASVAFLAFFAAMLAFMAVAAGAQGLIELTWWRWEGVLVSFPVVAYGFTAHQVLFSVYASMRSASLRRMTSVIQKSMLMSSLLYIAVGICGFLAFGHRTNGDILRNFGGSGVSGSRLALERILKVGYGVSLLATIPLVLMPLQVTIAPWLGQCSKAQSASSELQDNVTTALVLGGACTLAMLLPNVEYVFGLAGSTAAVVISFILPAAIFLQTTAAQRGSQGHSIEMVRGTASWKRRRCAAVGLLLFGVTAGVACTQALVGSIRQEGEVVQLVQQLVAEERKVAEAAETEAAAKAVAQQVGAVSEAKRALGKTKRGAGAAVAAVTAATLALEEARATLGRQRGAARELGADLRPVVKETDKLVAALESATESLGAAAVRLREEGSGAGSANGGGDDAAAAAAGEGQEAKAATSWDRAADALRALAAAAQEALDAVRQSRGALAVAQTAAARGGGGKKAADALDAVLRPALGVTTAAAGKLNATLTALQAAEVETTSQLVDIVAKLARQEDAAEKQLGANAKNDDGAAAAAAVGRKAAGGKGRQRPPPENAQAGDNSGTSEALKQISEAATGDGGGAGAAGGKVDAAGVANAAADVAANVLQAAKAAAGQALESKSAEVAGRAIEIAKELTAAPGRNATSAASSAIASAVSKQEEKAAHEQLLGNATEIADGTVVTDSGAGSEAAAAANQEGWKTDLAEGEDDTPDP